MRTSQEFFCNGCEGFIIVRLNMHINHVVEVVCPECGRKHRRNIKEGRIWEDGRHASDVKETVRPTMATYSKKARTSVMREARERGSTREGLRDGVPLETETMLSERWTELAQMETGNDD